MSMVTRAELIELLLRRLVANQQISVHSANGPTGVAQQISKWLSEHKQ